MAGTVFTATFAARQGGIPECGIVNLKYTEGDLRAEYLSGSEQENADGFWEYTFLIQEEDLPGGLTLAEASNPCNIIAPLWSCLADDEIEASEELCRTRVISCFSGLEVIETLEEGDYVAILRYDPECDIYCLKLMDPVTFKEQIELLA